MNEKELSYSMKMDNAINELKEVYKSSNNSILEYDYDNILWQKQMQNEMIIYLSYIGFLEAMQIIEESIIKWNKEKNNQQEVEIHNDILKNYLNERKSVIKLIKEESIILQFKFLEDAIDLPEIIPKMNEIFKPKYANESCLYLQNFFISAFKIGFDEADILDYNFVKEQFNKSILDIRNIKKGNSIKKIKKI